MKYLFPNNFFTKSSIIGGGKNPNNQKTQQHTTENKTATRINLYYSNKFRALLIVTQSHFETQGKSPSNDHSSVLVNVIYVTLL